MPEEELRVFVTKVWNRRKLPVHVIDSDGQGIVTLEPDQIYHIESVSPWTLFAPLGEVIWNEDGTVVASERAGWVDPYDSRWPWKVEVLNQDGAELEHRVLGGMEVFLPKGFFVPVFVPATNPFAKVERVLIKRVHLREESPDWFGYMIWREEIQDIQTPRNEKELALINQELKALEAKSQDKESA
jgi:hypothetical protein